MKPEQSAPAQDDAATADDLEAIAQADAEYEAGAMLPESAIEWERKEDRISMEIEYPTEKWCHDTIVELLNSTLHEGMQFFYLERGSVTCYTVEQLNDVINSEDYQYTNIIDMLKNGHRDTLSSVLEDDFQELYFAEVQKLNNMSVSEIMDDEIFNIVYMQYLDFIFPVQELEKITLDFLMCNARQ